MSSDVIVKNKLEQCQHNTVYKLSRLVKDENGIPDISTTYTRYPDLDEDRKREADERYAHVRCDC